MNLLAAREAYRLWAPHYESETAVSYLEDRLVHSMMPPTAGRTLVDVGCGTGRRLRGIDAALAVGVDLTPEMFAGAGVEGGGHLLAGDLQALPLATASFDSVWCRLVIGHLRDPHAAYAELARVCRPGGVVIVTDFHAAAVMAGHRRTFRDSNGSLHEIEHHVHTEVTQVAHARQAGLELRDRREGRVGPEILSFYERGGHLDAYAEQIGLPLVLALSFLRGGDP